ncbi:MAG: hypothetical protein CMJ49_05370 [Planctomycetaceae bacterium]|nr:hypothetical protein [Planctomycetaceae bacterium]
MGDGAGDPPLADLVAGRAEAFAALYDRYAAKLYRAAVAMLGSPQDAEDVVQEVFVSMVRSHNRLIAVRNLNAYLFTALRHAAHRRMMERSRLSLTDVDPPAIPVAETDDRLAQALNQLPTEQREVIALKIDGDLTFAQIGDALDISPNTAASRYRYALQKLRRHLEAQS